MTDKEINKKIKCELNKKYKEALVERDRQIKARVDLMSIDDIKKELKQLKMKE